MYRDAQRFTFFLSYYFDLYSFFFSFFLSFNNNFTCMATACVYIYRRKELVTFPPAAAVNGRRRLPHPISSRPAGATRRRTFPGN
jgi:hypothetical protein